MADGFEWYGDEVKRRVMRAAAIGINRTMAVAVSEAKATHPWRNRTGTAERSIRIWKGAQIVGDFVFGVWGSVSVAYFRSLELGAKAHAIANAFGKGRTVQHPGNKPFPTLIPTSVRVYPILPAMIRRAYGGMA